MREENAVSRAWGNCPACGYNNAPYESRCEKCGRRLEFSGGGSARRPEAEPEAGPYRTSSVNPESRIHAVGKPQPSENTQSPGRPQAPLWSPRPGMPAQEETRKQLSDRVNAFRSRRNPGNLSLQFKSDAEAAENREPRQPSKVVSFVKDSNPIPPPVRTYASPSPSPAAPRQARRATPAIPQPELDFPSPPSPTEVFLALPVAPFRLRLLGHAMDFALNLAAFVLFLLPLKLLVGPVSSSRLLMVGIAGAYLLVVLLYGGVFVYLAGATPTMKWMGLRLVNFDGARPGRKQLLCRYLGSIASVGSFFLGFLWAAIDEEKLSWHDRISKTFLTTAHPYAESGGE
jgi:uncharacterized RDD family membrane protein YckC